MAQEYIKSLESGRVFSVSDSRDAIITLTDINDPSYYMTILRNHYDHISTGTNTHFVPHIMTVVQKAAVVKPQHAPAAGSKLERAIEIYKSMPGASRQQIIQAFVSQLGMTPAGASTYQNTVKKKVG